MAEKLQPGICGICDTVVIWYKDEKTKRQIFTDQYAEFSFTLTDGLIYRHAICSRCIVDLTDKKVANLIDRIKEHWLTEMVGWGTDKQFATIRNSELAVYDLSEKKTLEKDKAYREKVHKDKLKDEKAKQAKKDN